MAVLGGKKLKRCIRSLRKYSVDNYVVHIVCKECKKDVTDLCDTVEHLQAEIGKMEEE